MRIRLNSESGKVYFLRNTTYFVPGIGIGLLALAGILLSAAQAPVALFMMVWLAGWSVGVYVLASQVIAAWRSRKVAGAMAISLFVMPFFGGEIFGIGVLASAISWPSLVLFLGIIAVNILFYHLLKAPTLAGRRLMDEIEGLKLYLEVAEKDQGRRSLHVLSGRRLCAVANSLMSLHKSSIQFHRFGEMADGLVHIFLFDGQHAHGEDYIGMVPVLRFQLFDDFGAFAQVAVIDSF